MLGLLIVGRRSSAREAPPVRQNPRPLPAPAHESGPSDEEVELWDPEPDRFDVLLEQYLSTDCCSFTFYQVGPDDTPESIAKSVLAKIGVFDDRHVLDYVYCISSSPWNLALYGGPSTSRRYPKRWLVPGFGQGLRAAFLPRNADAMALICGGTIPLRTVDQRAASVASNDGAYGLLWLPPVCPDQLRLGIVTCAPFSWSDGSSTINPDPEFIGMLEAA